MDSTNGAKALATTTPFIEIEYGRFPDLERIFGIKRGTAYALINEGAIRSRLVRLKGGRFATRLIDFNSVRQYLSNSPEKPVKTFSRHLERISRASVKSRKAKATARANGANGMK